jgi:hypothetical protein
MKRENERGFALLLVFMLAAAIAISLYKAMPRAAFESERNKEALLIDRGEQYTRAIQLFVTKFKRFPANMDELEKTNNIRFLRKKYVDPMTGKDDWRLLHVNALGILTDSKIKKKKKADSAAANNFISLAPTLDQNSANNGAAANLAMRRRPSDQSQIPGQPTAPVDPNAPPPPFDPNNPNAASAGQAPGQVNVLPNTAQAGQPYPGQPYPGQTAQGYTPGYGQSAQPQQGYPVNPATPNGRPQGTVGGAFGNSGFGNSFGNQQANPGGMQGGQQNGQQTAMGLIQGLLTSPSQMGPQGNTGTAGAITAGGIAGVASKFEGESIKIYNDRQKYEEWEFVYDMKNDKRLQQAIPGGVPVNPGNGQGGALQTGINGQPSSFGGQQPTGFGQQPAGAFGSQQGAFGQQTAGTGSQPSSSSAGGGGFITVAPGLGSSNNTPAQPAQPVKVPPVAPGTQQVPAQPNPNQPVPVTPNQTNPQPTNQPQTNQPQTNPQQTNQQQTNQQQTTQPAVPPNNGPN